MRNTVNAILENLRLNESRSDNVRKSTDLLKKDLKGCDLMKTGFEDGFNTNKSFSDLMNLLKSSGWIQLDKGSPTRQYFNKDTTNLYVEPKTIYTGDGSHNKAKSSIVIV